MDTIKLSNLRGMAAGALNGKTSEEYVDGVRDAVLDRAALRRLVDLAWNEATESETVPSTAWADDIIDRMLAGDEAVHTAVSPPPGETEDYSSHILDAQTALRRASEWAHLKNWPNALAAARETWHAAARMARYFKAAK